MGMGTALAAPTPLDNRFRIGVSYYGALALDWDNTVADEFCTLAELDYSVVRVWATWCGPDCDTGSLVNKSGNWKEPQKTRLTKMLQFAKGMVIDLTFEPAQFKEISDGTPSFDNYYAAIKKVVTWANNQGFKDNLIIDVCNECVVATDKDPDAAGYTSLANTQLSVFTYNGDPYPKNNPPTDWAVPLRDMIKLVRGQNIQAFFSVVAAFDTTTRLQDQQAVTRGRKYYEYVYNGGLNGAPLAPHFGRKPCDKWADWTDERIADLYVGTAVDAYPLYLQEENRRGWSGACCGGGSYEPSDPFKKDPCAGNCTSGTDIPEQDFNQAAYLARNNSTKKAWAWVFHTDAGFACGGNSFFNGSRLDGLERDIVCNLRNGVVLDKTPGDCTPKTTKCWQK